MSIYENYIDIARNTFNTTIKWRNGFDQIDDITLVGIQI